MMQKAGAYLREIRRAQNLSQMELANLVNVGRGTIERLEAGDNRVGVGTVLHVLKVLGASPWHFYELAIQPARTLADIRRRRSLIQGIATYVVTLAERKQISQATLAEMTSLALAEQALTANAVDAIPELTWLLAMYYLDAPLADLTPLLQANADHIVIGRRVADDRGAFVQHGGQPQSLDRADQHSIPSLDGVIYRLSGLLKFDYNLPTVLRHELTRIEADLRRYRSLLVLAVGYIKAEP